MMSNVRVGMVSSPWEGLGCDRLRSLRLSHRQKPAQQSLRVRPPDQIAERVDGLDPDLAVEYEPGLRHRQRAGIGRRRAIVLPAESLEQPLLLRYGDGGEDFFSWPSTSFWCFSTSAKTCRKILSQIEIRSPTH